MTGFYLLDHPNPYGPHYYTTRQRCQHGIVGPHLVVIHTAENLPDFVAPDLGAEGVARYGATTSRSVSWHATVDSDSTIPMLPSGFTAFHVRGFNRCGYGIEIATTAGSWDATPARWKLAALSRVADHILEVGLPTNVLGSGDSLAGYGIVGHARLDPARRSDPGAGFDWGLLSSLLKGGGDVELVKMIQSVLAAEGFTGVDGRPLTVDGVPGPDTRHAFDRMVQAARDGGVAPRGAGGFTDLQAGVLAGFADALVAAGSNGSGFATETVRLIRSVHEFADNR